MTTLPRLRFSIVSLLACMALSIPSSVRAKPGGSDSRPAPTAPPATSLATATRVTEAMEKAKAFLYAHQKDGNWEESQSPPEDLKNGHVAQWTGMTAIVTYGLLCAGETTHDPHVAAAIDFLTRTETRGIYAAGIRCLVWSSVEQTPKVKAAAKRDVTLLLSAMQKQGPGKGLYHYTQPTGPKDEGYDHSASQFAPLGLWSMARQGLAEVPADFWTSTDHAWRAHQYAEGSWSYIYYPSGTGEGGWARHTPSMTAAGVATLLITDEYLHSGVDCKGNPKDPNISKGLEWLGSNFETVLHHQFGGTPSQNYALFGVSRVGATGGYKYFGTVDWYQRGAAWLLSKQQPDGSWLGGARLNAADTSLGLLFLAYGSAPVVMNKLEYTLEASNNTKTKSAAAPAVAPAAHWNQRPQDALNFVKWMGGQLERRLNWQIVNLSAPVEELHDAPILFITGDQALSLSQQDQDKLRQFVEQGGMILGNADCGSPTFIKGFEQLGADLFPRYSFGDLPPSHPLFTAQEFRAAKWKTKTRVRGLSNGVRELMLLPMADLSGAFQSRADTARVEQFQLAYDIVLYSMDRSGLLAKGETYLVREDVAVPTAQQTISLARLEVGQNWDLEPGGWRRLAAILHNRHKVGLSVEPVKLGDGKLASHAIAHLTGTTSFALDQGQRDELKKFVQDGGTLVIDAAGGSQEFAGSAEKELADMFGIDPAKLATLPIHSPLYTIPDAKIDSVGYRRFAWGKLVGELKAPRVCGIEQSGRIVAFYSREDLSGGLVGEQVDGILGYDPASATSIMRNIILYCGGPGRRHTTAAPGAGSPGGGEGGK